MKKIFIILMLCFCPVLFAGGNKESEDIVITDFEDQITLFEDQITLYEDQIVNFEDSLTYLTEHVITTNDDVKEFQVIEYGSKDYYKTLDGFSIIYENFSDIVKPVVVIGEAVFTAYLFVQTGGASGFLIPMMGVPTTKRAAIEMAKYAGKKFLETELLASITGAVGVAREYAKYGDVDSGTFLEWHDEAFQWVALYQGAVGLKNAASAINVVNTPDTPLNVEGMKDRNIPSMKNGSYAGQTKYLEDLPEGAKVSRARRIAQKIGVDFSKDGYPNFKPYAKAVYNNGSVLPADEKEAFKLADNSIGINQEYRSKHGLVWHHGEDGKSLYLLDKDLHTPTQHGVAHNGGQSLISEYWDLFNSEGIAL